MHLTKAVNFQQLEEKNLDDDENSSDDDEEEDGEDGESDDTGEVSVTRSSDDNSSDTSSDDNDDDADPSTDEDEADAEVDDELRRQVAAALNMNMNANGDNEEEEQPMDDEQMLKLDDQLAAAFRMQQGPKLDKKRAESKLLCLASFSCRPKLSLQTRNVKQRILRTVFSISWTYSSGTSLVAR